MFVAYACWVVSVPAYCSFRGFLMCVCVCLIVCGWETSTMRRPRYALGCCVKKNCTNISVTQVEPEERCFPLSRLNSWFARFIKCGTFRSWHRHRLPLPGNKQTNKQLYRYWGTKEVEEKFLRSEFLAKGFFHTDTVTALCVIHWALLKRDWLFKSISCFQWREVQDTLNACCFLLQGEK